MKECLMIVTEKGMVKKVIRTDLKISHRAGKGSSLILLSLGDKVAGIKGVDVDELITIFTAQGKRISFPSRELRPMGRLARGVRAIMLEEGDRVVGFEI